MKFDTVILGGGLSGLFAGISLLEKGQKVAIVSSGESALHFNSGSMGLLSKCGEEIIENPIEAIDKLSEQHPYRKIGKERAMSLADNVPSIFSKAGVKVYGNCNKNHYTLTPFGSPRPSWLTLDEFVVFDNSLKPSFDRCLVVSLKGFLESYPGFAEQNLTEAGVNCRTAEIELKCISRLLKAGFDMRSISIAKQVNTEALNELALEINNIAEEGETVLIPAVVGIWSENQIEKLREMVNNPLFCLPTVPVSVAGFRTQNSLRHYFEKLGGYYLIGDKVVKGNIEGNEVREIVTHNLGSDIIQADNYILSTGSLFSEGIVSTPRGFDEPVFGLDVDFPAKREDWYSADFFAPQPYMCYGVTVDGKFHPAIKGEHIKNLFAVGAVVGGCDSLNENSGAGVAILTALHVAELISGSQNEKG